MGLVLGRRNGIEKNTLLLLLLLSVPVDRTPSKQRNVKSTQMDSSTSVTLNARKLVKELSRMQSRFRDKAFHNKITVSVYTDGSVTEDQSGWSCNAKQGATTIHQYHATYKVSTSRLTMEMEAVT